ncbi:ribokinase [Microterricola viridarii]|uniref:Ribokinase n=1 Tax=Microterricola viridarii TaxID=412690 RepID=A0A0Y0PFM9_9MICO|nr:ribokinase [Microterricola viridarii]AMB59978.1 hypothetical protein AWU67_15190 [Microterricola viridarii]
MAPKQETEIVVVGSANIDLVATVESRPQPGETVHALGYAEFLGGKGSNQAIAAARLGRQVAFVGLVGNDPEAQTVRGALANEGIDLQHLASVKSFSTGRAIIIVDSAAENSIVVVGGANAQLGTEHIAAAAELIENAPIVVAQLEIPIETVTEVARMAKGTFVLNPAPAQPLPAALLDAVDILVVNETEYESVSGCTFPEDRELLAEQLRTQSLPAAVVITLGGQGALVWDSTTLSHISTPRVQVVDTTGAGDTFIGALVDALSRGENLTSAAHWAVHAASLSVGALGATVGMPRRQEVAALLENIREATPPRLP